MRVRTAAELYTAPAQSELYSVWVTFVDAALGIERRAPPLRLATRFSWRSLEEGAASAAVARMAWTKRAVTNIVDCLTRGEREKETVSEDVSPLW